MEKKMITVVGTKANEGELTDLHVAICDCGNKIVRAAKESSLNFFIEKHTCKECGSKLHYAGLMTFNGKEIVVKEEKKEEAPKAAKKDKNTPVHVIVDGETINVTDLVKPGRKGVTNKQMITALIENIDNDKNLRALFYAYESVFMGSVPYTKDAMKVKLRNMVRAEKYPEFNVNMGKKMMEQVG